jgi:hypothetical protein
VPGCKRSGNVKHDGNVQNAYSTVECIFNCQLAIEQTLLLSGDKLGNLSGDGDMQGEGLA